MKWNKISIKVPFTLLEQTYNFLWHYINGISVERIDNHFRLNSYVVSTLSQDLAKRLTKFLRIQAKTYKSNFTLPELTEEIEKSSNFIAIPYPNAYVPDFGIPVFIQRGRAFGIGSHPCTLYCLNALTDLYLSKKHPLPSNTLDAGTGTGILSIAAARIGIRKITAVEISPESVMEARENFIINKVLKFINLKQGSVTEISEKFDLILANLFGDLLIQIAGMLVDNLTENGLLIAGGMAVPQNKKVISIFKNLGLNEKKRYQDENWCVSVLNKI
ncbi:MAG: 50S ribosomal protein L11 methyltransferase [Nitrospirae bacterium]|jgi:ribosomal protein L11 methylase PrmA|nr:50S ribosomal protein L11 methyltransferase [Nitrospirota bacterium]